MSADDVRGAGGPLHISLHPNSAVIIGPPYVHLSVAHGTAYDIVGKGIADHRMMLNAMRTARSRAAGAGFPKEL